MDTVQMQIGGDQARILAEVLSRHNDGGDIVLTQRVPDGTLAVGFVAETVVIEVDGWTEAI